MGAKIATMEEKLVRKLRRSANQTRESKPAFFKLSRKKDREKVLQLLEEGSVQHVVDDYEEQQRELFQVKNPTKVYTETFEEEFQTYYAGLQERHPIEYHGTWVYFPWISSLSHILEEDDFYHVRTARNRNLITQEEQDKFYNSVIGIGGLSVGNSIVLSLVLMGGAKHLRIADFDELALSNTNRVRAGVQNLGTPKITVTAQQVYTLNPYATVEVFKSGIQEKNIERFFNGGGKKLDVMIDELDNLAVKYRVREFAKKYRVPIVMAADNGDDGVVDIERYDLNKNTPFFHGRMGKVSYEMLKGLKKFEIGRLIAKHVGAENVHTRMMDSLPEMGKTIVSWPQLGGAAQLNGVAVAFCVRRILNNQELENNRALVSVEEKLVPSFSSKKEKDFRKKKAAVFKKMLDI